MPPRKQSKADAPHVQMAEAQVLNRMVEEPKVTRPPSGRAVAIGRDGKPIWRTASATGEDPYAMAKAYEPEGWVYEWKRYSIHNKIEEAYHSNLMRAGAWSFVTHETHPGIFGKMGATGIIIIGDQALMERPLSLHREAMADEKKTADERLRRAKTERGLQAASSGVDTNTPDARAATYVKQPYDPDLAQDIASAKPKYDRDNMTID